MTFISTLSIIVVVSTITSVSSQIPDNILTEILEYEDKILDKQNTKVYPTDHVHKFFAIHYTQSGVLI
ncbi:MAG: hypothetical protein ACPKPY_05250 [Nitrososphaeraceae archaeon]